MAKKKLVKKNKKVKKCQDPTDNSFNTNEIELFTENLLNNSNSVFDWDYDPYTNYFDQYDWFDADETINNLKSQGTLLRGLIGATLLSSGKSPYEIGAMINKAKLNKSEDPTGFSEYSGTLYNRSVHENLINEVQENGLAPEKPIVSGINDYNPLLDLINRDFLSNNGKDSLPTQLDSVLTSEKPGFFKQIGSGIENAGKAVGSAFKEVFSRENALKMAPVVNQGLLLIGQGFGKLLDRSKEEELGWGAAKQAASINPYASMAVQALDTIDLLTGTTVKGIDFLSTLADSSFGSKFNSSRQVNDKTQGIIGGGLLGGWSRLKKKVRKAQLNNATAENISNKAEDYLARVSDDTASLNYLARANGFNDDTPYGMISISKQGSKLMLAKQIVSKYNSDKLLLKFQKGNKINKTRSLEELIDYAKKENPRFIQRLSEKPRGIEFEDKGIKQRGNVYLEWSYKPNSDRKIAIVYPTIQEEYLNGPLKFYGDQALDRVLETNEYLEMTPEEADIFSKNYKKGWPFMFNIDWTNDNSIIENLPKHKEGGQMIPLKILELKTIIPEFQQGGEINVIPGGALHAHKHNIDIDGITKKGIPVVSQTQEGEIEQQAEIEKNEIIYRLQITEKLEDLYKRYYSDEATQKDKDEFALEAGKLLVYETLYNTQDNTGLIDEIQI